MGTSSDITPYNIIEANVRKRTHSRIEVKDGDSSQSSVLSSKVPTLSSYEFERVLGEGAQGKVLKCTQDCVSHALKIITNCGNYDLTQSQTAGESAYRALLEKNMLLQNCNHTNIIPIHKCFIAHPGDAVTKDTSATATLLTPALCLELPLCHCDLQSAVLTSEPTLLGSGNRAHLCWRVLHQVASGLNWLHVPEQRKGHRVGVPRLHRDIKPENVLLVDPEGTKLMIADLDSVGELLGGAVRLREERDLTYEYQPPESVFGSNEATCATDIWSLGATIVFMVPDNEGYHEAMLKPTPGARVTESLNSPDFTDERLRFAISQHFNQARINDAELISLISSMLSVNPDDRPTAKDVMEMARDKLG